VENAPIRSFTVNQSHIDTVAMLHKQFTKWRLLVRLTDTPYRLCRRICLLNIYQTLTILATESP